MTGLSMWMTSRWGLIDRRRMKSPEGSFTHVDCPWARMTPRLVTLTGTSTYTVSLQEFLTHQPRLDVFSRVCSVDYKVGKSYIRSRLQKNFYLRIQNVKIKLCNSWIVYSYLYRRKKQKVSKDVSYIFKRFY